MERRYVSKLSSEYGISPPRTYVVQIQAGHQVADVVERIGSVQSVGAVLQALRSGQRLRVCVCGYSLASGQNTPAAQNNQRTFSACVM